MNLMLGIVVGLKEIWAHKFRSALTMLGIVLGVSSLVGMFALVSGMTQGWRATMQEIGGLERVSVIDQPAPQHQEHLAELSPGRTVTDVEAIRATAPLIDAISPEVSLRPATLVRGNKSYRPRTVAGVSPAFLQVNNHEVAFGRFLADLDLDNVHNVCVIGTRVRDELFPANGDLPDEIPLGEIININDQPFTVVGLFRYYESETARKRREAGVTDRAAERAEQRRSQFGRRHRGANWFDWKNDTVVIPLTTMQQVFMSGAREDGLPDQRLSELNLRVADVERLDEAIQQVKNVLLFTHRGVEDFGFNTMENWAERIEESTGNALRTGGLIASIALIVGGIGIMNIMLASISERIREIGIRKAVGARQRDIFLQILVESTVLAVVGGLLGLCVAFGLVRVLEWLAPFDYAPIVQPWAMLVSFLFSAGVGALAGLYPAFKASRLDPIEALRYE
jgi:putative ABC transport system permease protein